METGLPEHVASARTWSAMLTWWQDRPEPAVVADGLQWSGAELLERAAGASEQLIGLTERSGPVPALVTSGATAFAYVVGAASCGSSPCAARATTHGA